MGVNYILLLLTLGGLVNVGYAQTVPDYRFKTLSFNEGLSQANVNSIVQDSLGYVWLATENGLNRYDGTEVRVFKHVYGDTTSLLDNYVSKLFIDRQHRMWLATTSGVCRYHPERNSFESYRLDTIMNTPHHVPLDIVEDSHGQILVLSNYNTVLKYSETQNAFQKHLSINSGETVRTLCVHRDRWFAGSSQYLLEINPTTGSVLHHSTLKRTGNTPPPLSSGITGIIPIKDQLWLVGSEMPLHRFDLVTQVLESTDRLPHATSLAPLSDTTFLVGSREGLQLYHPQQDRVLPIRSVDDQIVFKNVFSVFVDRDQNLWASVRPRGVIHTAGKRVFRDTRHLNLPSELNHYIAEVTAMDIVDGDQLWMGLNTGQIMAMDLKDRSFRLLPEEADSPTRPGRGTIFDLFTDRQHRVWVGSYQGGLRRYDSTSHTFVAGWTEADSLPLRSQDVRSMVEDEQGRLWLAVHGQGVDVYDPAQHQVVASYGASVGDRHPHIGNWTFQLVMAPDSAVWIASASGLHMVKGTTKRHFQHETQSVGSLSSSQVKCLALDRRGHLWIGTSEGLNVLNPEDSSFTTFTTQQGLNDNSISSIIEDQQGNLWIGTYDGLARLSYTTDPKAPVIENVALPPGLYSNQFVDRACAIDSAGNLFFTTTHGLLTFHPDDLPHLTVPPVRFTNFKLFNEPLERLQSTAVPWAGHAVNQTSEVRLAPHENTVTVGFASVDFAHYRPIEYHYRLQGYEDDWSTSIDQQVTYYDLPPGAYRFLVKAMLPGISRPSVVKSLNILVEKPWYDTLYGQAAVLLSIGALLWWVVHVRLERSQLQHQALLSQKEREIDQFKIRFFTNLSHEFKTPLTLILGPLEQLTHFTKDGGQLYVTMIQRNAKRLSGLVNQLLDLRSLEEHQYLLRITQGSLVQAARQVYESFAYQAQQRSIAYSFVDQTQASGQQWFDHDVLNKVLYNLIANAFKYTPDQGHIRVSIAEHPSQPHRTVIEVNDTGVGIPAEQLDKIFDRFYRSDATAQQEGTGIGLSLCQELVQLHQGEIAVTSTLEQGSTFTVTLPTRAQDYPSVANAPETYVSSQTHHPDLPPPTTPPGNEAPDRAKPPYNKPLVLVADDNSDLLTFVKQSLAERYTIITAQNGQIAFQRALARMPSAIVSDVMMPVMDGLMLTKQLKEDLRTSHIPVILLTARSDEQHQVEGLELRADDYITKPFSTAVLAASLQSLIANRTELKKIFTQNNPSDILQQVDQNPEKEFLLTLTHSIEERLDDTTLGVDDLCRAVGMSKSQLYRKLSAVTGKTVVEFVKLYRLSKAAELLRTGPHTISEVAHLTGFKHVQSFVRSFKGEYGHTPGQHAKRDLMSKARLARAADGVRVNT